VARVTEGRMLAHHWPLNSGDVAVWH